MHRCERFLLAEPAIADLAEGEVVHWGDSIQHMARLSLKILWAESGFKSQNF